MIKLSAGRSATYDQQDTDLLTTNVCRLNINILEQFTLSREIKTRTGGSFRYFPKAIGGLPERIGIMGEDEYQAAVAAFIRTKGVTRCPTACALPTQGIIAADDRAALEDYAITRTRWRRQRQAARRRSFWAAQGPAY